MKAVKKPKDRDKKKKSRLTLELALTFRESLDRIQAESGAASLTEVLRHAVAVYDRVIQEKKKGSEVILRSPDGRETSIFLVLG
jgi:hypothetical protein